MASSPIASQHIGGETMETVKYYFLGLQKSLQMVTAAIKLKGTCSLEEKFVYDKPRQCSKKQGHYFTDQGPYSQNYAFFQ